MSDTTIEWTDAVWNPVTGCTKVSEGCRHCYAERVFPRAYGKTRKFTDVQIHPDRLDQPLRWKKPRRVFVNSMSDLFHEDVPLWFVDRVFGAMAAATQHTFQILTKRPKRMAHYLCTDEKPLLDRIDRWASSLANSPCAVVNGWPLPNVWLGVSVEDQKTADQRIPLLLQTPAAVRFVSYEPALGPVDFGRVDLLQGNGICGDKMPMNLAVLDWIIVGGESGPKARSFNVQWARDTIQQCKATGVACFVKQLGAKPMYRSHGDDDPRHLFNGLQTLHSNGSTLKDPKGGDWEEWPYDLRVRTYPKTVGAQLSPAGR